MANLTIDALTIGASTIIDSSGNVYAVNISVSGTASYTTANPTFFSSTGSGAVVLATSPTLVTPTLGIATATSLTSADVYGGSAVGSTLILQGTSNGSPSSAYVVINSNGQNVGIGTASPGYPLDVTGTVRFAGGSTSALIYLGTDGVGFIYRPSANVLQFGSTSLESNVDASYDFGTSSLRWRDIYLGGAAGHGNLHAAEGGVVGFDGATGGTFDTGISRGGAGVIDVGNGTQGNTSGTINTGTATFTTANPTFFSAQGNGSKVQLSTGTTTTGDVVTYDANGNTIDSGTLLTSLTITVASGTTALGTSLIASGAAATIITQTATGALTTDNLTADFNADPTGVVGYKPSASGMLTIVKFITAGHVNFYVVNNTGASITPGAVTLQWRVVR